MTITLLDGRTVESELIAFDPDTYHFDLAGQDVTNLIRRADKLNMVAGFDVDRENQRVFEERSAPRIGEQFPGWTPSPVGSTSTLENFWRQLTTDPLAAPLDTLNRAVNQVFAAPAVVKIALALGTVALVVWIVRRRP